MGIRTKLTKDSIKIFGDPTINFRKSIKVENYYKDHRVFMTSVIAALTFGGKWKIDDIDSYKSSFPSFLKILKKLGYEFKFVWQFFNDICKKPLISTADQLIAAWLILVFYLKHRNF